MQGPTLDCGQVIVPLIILTVNAILGDSYTNDSIYIMSTLLLNTIWYSNKIRI